MDDWEKFNERSLPEKEDFYCHLIMENITDPHTQKQFVQIYRLSKYMSWNRPYFRSF